MYKVDALKLPNNLLCSLLRIKIIDISTIFLQNIRTRFTQKILILKAILKRNCKRVSNKLFIIIKINKHSNNFYETKIDIWIYFVYNYICIYMFYIYLYIFLYKKFFTGLIFSEWL